MMHGRWLGFLFGLDGEVWRLTLVVERVLDVLGDRRVVGTHIEVPLRIGRVGEALHFLACFRIVQAHVEIPPPCERIAYPSEKVKVVGCLGDLFRMGYKSFSPCGRTVAFGYLDARCGLLCFSDFLRGCGFWDRVRISFTRS